MTSRLLNLGDCLSAAPSPHNLALAELAEGQAPRWHTYHDLNSQANAVARGLIGNGYKHGQRAAILSANRAEYLTAYFGTMRAGLVPVPINFKLPKQTIERILVDSESKLVFCDPDRRASCPPNVAVVEIDREGKGGFEKFLNHGDFESVAPAKHDLALLLYTSGSQGTPKGVRLTHAGMTWAVETRTAAQGKRRDVRALVVAPLYHMNGLTNITLQFRTGAASVLMRRFDACQYLRAIAEFRCTALGVIPAMMAMAAKERKLIGELDVTSVRQVVLGSAPCTVSLFEKVERMFPNATVSLGYGATEIGPCVFGPHPEEKRAPRLSIGFPLPSVEVQLAGGQHPDQGELQVRSPAVSPGYLNLPKETSDRFEDGWYSSGDIMRRDTHGFYYFVSRIDDMFVCAGENIYPSEAEATLERNIKIHQAAVVPLDDEIKGQVPVAFVVCKPGIELSEQEVKAFALEHGPAYQHPRRVAFVDELPLASTHKIDRRALIERAKVTWG